MKHVIGALALVGSMALGGCGDDGSGLAPDVALAVGTYAAEGAFGATTFTTHGAEGDEVVDWLAQGGSIRLELKGDMTTAGRLFVPGADESGGDVDEDLTGTWSLVSGRVALEHDADTFLRDMPFAREGEALVGHETFDDTTIDVELRRR